MTTSDLHHRTKVLLAEFAQFEKHCDIAQYTDTGSLWTFAYALRQLLKQHLKELNS